MRPFVGATLVVLMACGAPPPPASAQAAQAAQAGPVGSLDQLLAPIALYPDSLLAQILVCSQTPPKVAELDIWLQNNHALKGTPLQDAAVKAGFEPSFVALTLFPQVVSKMAMQIDRTALLGQAFTADRNAVFASIQKLRQQAKAVGTLKTTPQQEVETRTTEAGEQVIVIEPTNPQIIYVPQYNTTTVYTQAPSTTVVVHDDDDAAEAAAAGLIGFTAGIAIGAAINNNYYYGPYARYGGAYMYNDAWDDYYDHREDQREDWQDHREDIADERGDRRENTSEQRTDRRENTSEQRTDRRESTQGQRTERTETRTENRPQSQTERTGTQQRSGAQAGTQSRSAGKSDAFSGYSSGASQRSASSRGKTSSGGSRGGGGGSRSGGGRRR